MGQKRVSPFSVIKGIYQNPFQWSVLKSMGLFFLGVRIAKEFVGVEIMPALPPV